MVDHQIYFIKLSIPFHDNIPYLLKKKIPFFIYIPNCPFHLVKSLPFNVTSNLIFNLRQINSQMQRLSRTCWKTVLLGQEINQTHKQKLKWLFSLWIWWNVFVIMFLVTTRNSQTKPCTKAWYFQDTILHS
jgi:hypothetical protein